MTTAAPLISSTRLPLNVTTRSQELSLYQSKTSRGVVLLVLALPRFYHTLNLEADGTK